MKSAVVSYSWCSGMKAVLEVSKSRFIHYYGLQYSNSENLHCERKTRSAVVSKRRTILFRVMRARPGAGCNPGPGPFPGRSERSYEI